MNKYIPLHVHSHFSLLDGVSQSHQIVERLDELGLDSCAISDHSSISGCPEFAKDMKSANKKFILGNEFYISEGPANYKSTDNRKKSHQVILAKNKNGWNELIQMTSISNHPDNFYYKPRIDLEILSKFAQNKNLISFSGHLGSTLADAIIYDNCLIPNWKQVGSRIALKMQDIFGKGNFFIEIQLIDFEKLSIAGTLAGALREISKLTGIPCVATPDAHYPSKDRAIDQRILLCRNLNTNFKKISSSKDDDGLFQFFKSDNYHIPSFDEMKLIHEEEEIKNTLLIGDMCEYYDITNKPILPKIKNDEDEYLRQLCREGWKRKIEGRIPKHEHSTYAERIKMELEVLQGAGLSGYFLILEDVVRYMRSQNWLVGPGRGSAAGCLVSYLVGITNVNPIKYNLLFERFYNAGRNTKDKISYPDIDTDVPPSKRNDIIEYIRNRFGEDYVSQISSFQTIKGRGALRTVFNAYGNMSFEELNEMTNPLPDEAKIASDLQEMEDEEGESSLIKWTLENKPKDLEQYCTMDDNGNLNGPYAKEFEIAIRLEKTKVSSSKHPAGVIVCGKKLSDICPMVYDKESKRQIIGYDMKIAEDVGLIKFDILGLQTLENLMYTSQILEHGEVLE